MLIPDDSLRHLAEAARSQPALLSSGWVFVLRNHLGDRMARDIAASVKAGDVLADKYRVEQLLGLGGMGAVVEATHLELGGRRAIKFMHSETVGDAEAVQRFLREARAAARLSSEHVVKIHDVGRFDSGEPYMVMEFLQGDDLANRLRRVGRLPVKKVATWVLQALEAIAEAHSVGIIHRDLKPANLFVGKDTDGLDTVKVLDFGISKVSGSGMRITNSTAVFGSPNYMPPEQMLSSADVDPRSDIWSVGVMLYELTTGRLPFAATSIASLALEVMNSEPVPMRAVDPKIPAAFEAIVGRCLRKERRERYENVAELAAELVPFGDSGAERSLWRIRRWLGGATAVGPHGSGAPAEPRLSGSTGASRGGFTAQLPGPPSAEVPRGEDRAGAAESDSASGHPGVKEQVVTAPRSFADTELSAGQRAAGERAPQGAGPEESRHRAEAAATQFASSTGMSDVSIPGLRPARTGILVAVGLAAILVVGGAVVLGVLHSSDGPATTAVAHTSSAPVEPADSTASATVPQVAASERDAHEADADAGVRWSRPNPVNTAPTARATATFIRGGAGASTATTAPTTTSTTLFDDPFGRDRE